MIPRELFDPESHPVLDENGYWVALTFLRCLTRTRCRVLLHPSTPANLGEHILLGLLDMQLPAGSPPLRELARHWLDLLEALPCPEHRELQRAESEIGHFVKNPEVDLALVRAIVVFQSHARCSALLKHGETASNVRVDRNRIVSAVTGLHESIVASALELRNARPSLFDVAPNKPLSVALEETVWLLYRNYGSSLAELEVRDIEDVGASRLGLKDYPHLSAEIACALALLRDAKTPPRAMNILLHGPPGHGKTELAGVLARESGHLAQRTINAALQFQIWNYKRSGRGVLILDEADALLRRAKEGDNVLERKREMNDLLDTPGQPCIWIVNDLDGIEASFLRRFQLIIEPSDPTRGVQRNLLKRRFPGSPAQLADIEFGDGVSPALVDQYATVVDVSTPETPEVWKARFVALLHQHTHACRSASIGGRGRRRTQVASQANPGATFRPGYVAPDSGLLELLRPGLPPGRILLHGPPGTGKTLFARALADAHGLALVTKSPSDLISPWIGETEQRLAAAFSEAAANGAILFLDELDGILHSRERAQRGWEVTQVNELLMQMDRYEGWMIAATNAIDRVDSAALRRFDLKIALRPPSVELRLAMVSEWLGTLGVDAGADSVVRARTLDGLVPGDLACVSRRLRFAAQPITATLALDLLVEELRQRGRDPAARPFGFAGATMTAKQEKH